MTGSSCIPAPCCLPPVCGVGTAWIDSGTPRAVEMSRLQLSYTSSGARGGTADVYRDDESNVPPTVPNSSFVFSYMVQVDKGL